MASDGLVALVTGAAQGLGFAISEILLQEGYKVCLAEVNEGKAKESLAQLQKKYGAGKVFFTKCDVTSETSFEEAFSKTLKEFGRIDVLVNNAGTTDEYRPSLMLQLNLMGTIIGCQLALKYMGTSKGGKGGVIINVSSIVGLVKSTFTPVYAATKHGVVGLTRSYGDQFHFDKNGVLFMAICPNAIRTPLLLETGRALIEVKDMENLKIMEPEYVAQGVIRLLKDKINGSTLLINPDKMEYVDVSNELKEMAL